MSEGSKKFSCDGAAPWKDDVDGVKYRYSRQN